MLNNLLITGAKRQCRSRRGEGVFTMRSAVLNGFLITAAIAGAPAAARADSRPLAGAPAVIAPLTIAPMSHAPLRGVTMPAALSPPNLPPMREGEAGYGRAAVEALHYGYRLPPVWQDDQYFIGDYRSIGLRDPAPGFGWSRYGDVAVLTDQWGRVYDWRDRIDWRRMRRGGGWRTHWQTGGYQTGGCETGGCQTGGYSTGGYDGYDRGGYAAPVYATSPCNTGCGGELVYEQVVAGPPIVTTSTSTYYETVYDRVARPVRHYAPVRRQVWHPARVAKRAPKCVIGS